MSQTFPERVYEVVSAIPAGKVSTYGQIAALAGSPRASRIVGAAMFRGGSKNLPCHRVVYRDGSLCPGDVFGGEGIQRGLLEQEGIPFLPNGKVNLSLCLWDGCAGLD